ncbi:MAG: hypothetical protein SGI99_17230, partial [Pseudomonadota bacterium]|nr:hypothetical protein [Pseudomonadota bacterium]
AVVACLLASCATRHHDVLIFGTDTSLGVNVGADPANAQVTNISIGYKRREAVWMPLIVNATESAVYCAQFDRDTGECIKRLPGVVCIEPVDAQPEECARWGQSASWNPKYLGEAKGVSNQVGGSTLESDTYSVFASFGGEASGGTGTAKAAVAQFFATGIAAQRLGASDNASKLISTSPVDAEGEQAKGQVQMLQSTVDTLSSAKATQATGDTDRSKITDCLFGSTVTADQRTAKLNGIAAVPGLRDTDVLAIKAATTPSALQAVLSADSIVNDLDLIATAACTST